MGWDGRSGAVVVVLQGSTIQVKKKVEVAARRRGFAWLVSVPIELFTNPRSTARPISSQTMDELHSNRQLNAKPLPSLSAIYLLRLFAVSPCTFCSSFSLQGYQYM
jgi:hypothetical protein